MLGTKGFSFFKMVHAGAGVHLCVHVLLGGNRVLGLGNACVVSY
jgi:hypothetical protein